MPLVVRIPDLHLRSAAQIKPGVARDGHDAPVGPKLEIFVIFHGGEGIAALETVEEQIAVAHAPVLAHPLVGDLLHLGALFRRRGTAHFGVVELPCRRNALPVGEIGLAAGEIRLEPLWALHRLRRADVAHFRIGGQFFDADIAPLDVPAVAEPADGTGHIVDPGMAPAVGSVAVAFEFGNIALGDEIAVEIHLDLAADDLDFLEIPHPRPARVAAAGGEIVLLAAGNLLAGVVVPCRAHAVQRSAELVQFELVLTRLRIVVFAAAVVEELHFAHAEVGRVLSGDHPDAETVVAVPWHAELEAEDEVRVRTRRVEVAAHSLLEHLLALREALENAGLLVAHAIHLDGAFPAVEIFSVEYGNESFVNRLRIPACGRIAETAT